MTGYHFPSSGLSPTIEPLSNTSALANDSSSLPYATRMYSTPACSRRADMEPPVVWYGPQTGLDLCSRLGSPLGREEQKVGSRNAGAKAGAPCSPAVSRGFPGLKGINSAASAECGRSGRPWRAGRPHESCECFLGTALREMVVAVELPAPWRFGRACWPALYDSPFGFHVPSRHVRANDRRERLQVQSRRESLPLAARV